MPPLSTGRVRVLILSITLFLAGVLAGTATSSLWRELDRGTERFSTSCELRDEVACTATADSIASFPDMALFPRPEARVQAILVRAMRETDAPRTAQGQWVTEITLSNGDRIVAPCFYSSDYLVACELADPVRASG